MNVTELQTAVSQLSSDQLTAFTDWFETFIADAWDRQLEADACSGQLDHLIRKADEDFDAGRCTSL